MTVSCQYSVKIVETIHIFFYIHLILLQLTVSVEITCLSCCFLGPGSFLEMDLPERRLVSRMFCTVIFLKKTFLVLVTQELLLSSNYKYSSGLYFFLPPSLLIIPFESVVIIPERQHILISADMFFIGNQRQSIKSKITAFQARWKHLKILVTSPFQFVDIFLL